MALSICGFAGGYSRAVFLRPGVASWDCVPGLRFADPGLCSGAPGLRYATPRAVFWHPFRARVVGANSRSVRS